MGASGLLTVSEKKQRDRASQSCEVETGRSKKLQTCMRYAATAKLGSSLTQTIFPSGRIFFAWMQSSCPITPFRQTNRISNCISVCSGKSHPGLSSGSVSGGVLPFELLRRQLHQLIFLWQRCANQNSQFPIPPFHSRVSFHIVTPFSQTCNSFVINVALGS